jgi:transcriptional regulator with XRE-family HTH domain
MITFEIIGQRIKKGREEIEISQKELATKLCEIGFNISRETVSKIEGGSRIANALELKAICEIINLSQDEILHEETENDLVSLFRSRGNKLSEEAASELDEIQDFIKGIIAQKNIINNKVNRKKFEASWR